MVLLLLLFFGTLALGLVSGWTLVAGGSDGTVVVLLLLLSLLLVLLMVVVVLSRTMRIELLRESNSDDGTRLVTVEPAVSLEVISVFASSFSSVSLARVASLNFFHDDFAFNDKDGTATVELALGAALSWEASGTVSAELAVLMAAAATVSFSDDNDDDDGVAVASAGINDSVSVVAPSPPPTLTEFLSVCDGVGPTFFACTAFSKGAATATSVPAVPVESMESFRAWHDDNFWSVAVPCPVFFS